VFSKKEKLKDHVEMQKHIPKKKNEQAAAELVRINGNYAREDTVDASKANIA
jgi:hypothetical protein